MGIKVTYTNGRNGEVIEVGNRDSGLYEALEAVIGEVHDAGLISGDEILEVGNQWVMNLKEAIGAPTMTSVNELGSLAWKLNSAACILSDARLEDLYGGKLEDCTLSWG